MITLTTHIKRQDAEELVSAILEAQLNATVPNRMQFHVGAVIQCDPPASSPSPVVTPEANEELCKLLRKENWSDKSQKITNIKELRRLIPGLGLAAARYMVEGGSDL